jgi:hypothetical protein
MGDNLYGNNGLAMILDTLGQMGQQSPMFGTPGQVLNPADRSTWTNNPTVMNAANTAAVYGAGPVAAMMAAGGVPAPPSPLGNGFTVTTHSVSVNPSANDRYKRMTQRRQGVASARAARAGARIANSAKQTAQPTLGSPYLNAAGLA